MVENIVQSRTNCGEQCTCCVGEERGDFNGDLIDRIPFD